jgi:putative SOS response-associated peptidase YedK
LRDEKRPFAMAGIWDEWINKKTGEIKRGFAIVTAPANDLMRKIGHHRSPVILNEADEKKWLDLQTPLTEITAMLAPYPAEEMNAYRVSSQIKDPEASDFSLLLPIGERIYPEYNFEITRELELLGTGQRRLRRTKNKSKEDSGQLDLFS